MPFIHYYDEQPVLRNPTVIVAFGGWNDAADSATTVIKFLIQRWQPQKIAEIDAEEFLDFTEARPTIKYVNGMQRTIVWPTNQFRAYVAPELHRDIILFNGVEPHLKWKTFSHSFLEVCQHFHASEVVFLGALLADVAHSLSVPITGTSTDAHVMERLREMDVHGSRYEGPTGMIGVLHDACQRAYIPSASLWAAAPHYLAATPNIKVTAALLTYLNAYLSFGLDLSDIQSDAVYFEEQITTLVAKDPEASAYVHKLEEQSTNEAEEDEDEEATDTQPSLSKLTATGPLPSADSLIRDVEDLLRKQRENRERTQLDNQQEDE